MGTLSALYHVAIVHWGHLATGRSALEAPLICSKDIPLASHYPFEIISGKHTLCRTHVLFKDLQN